MTNLVNDNFTFFKASHLTINPVEIGAIFDCLQPSEI